MMILKEKSRRNSWWWWQRMRRIWIKRSEGNKRKHTILVFNLFRMLKGIVTVSEKTFHWIDVSIHRPHHRCQSILKIYMPSKNKCSNLSIKFSKSSSKFINIQVNICSIFFGCCSCCTSSIHSFYRCKKCPVYFRDSQCLRNSISMARWIGLKASWSMHEFSAVVSQ